MSNHLYLLFFQAGQSPKIEKNTMKTRISSKNVVFMAIFGSIETNTEEQLTSNESNDSNVGLEKSIKTRNQMTLSSSLTCSFD